MEDERSGEPGSAGDGRAPARRGRPRLDGQMVPRILDAAERLFAARSGASVSIRDIATEAGLPHSAIYRYFKGKDDILRQVLQRGRTRQLLRDVRSREEGVTLEGAVDWFAHENRAYAMAIARAALDGETLSSLGLDPQTSAAAAAARLLEEGTYPFRLRTDFPPRLVAAAVMALSLGWAVAEEWIVEAAGLQDQDLAEVRRQLGEVIGSVMALSGGRTAE